jgi:predicted nucleic acid-binding protein
VSFAVMRERGIDRAFAFDQHFEADGLVTRW